MARICVFLDYQNVYRGAREAFHSPSDPNRLGQVDPLRLAELIQLKDNFADALVGVRVYRGRPVAERDKRGHAANVKQCSAWEKSSPKVSVHWRPLSYPRGRPPLEKGIDVELAVDFVRMAVRGDYDIGVIMSTDADLRPALEAVLSLDGNPYPRVAVAAWSTGSHAQRLSVPGEAIWCHWLNKADYEAVADRETYGD